MGGRLQYLEGALDLLFLYRNYNIEGITSRVNFAKHKGNIPPAARGDLKWCDTRLFLTLKGGTC